MKEKMPPDHASRNKDGAAKIRKPLIDPAGLHRVDPDERTRRSQAQAGQDLRDPQKGADNGE